MKTYKTFQNKHQKNIIFFRGDWNAKVESQEIPGVKGKFGLGVQNEAGQRLTECPGHSEHPFSTRDDFTRGDQKMVNTKIRLITFFIAEDGEVIYSQRKRD